MTDKISSDDEILEFAIAREVEAHQLYMYMAACMENPEIRKVCEDFAKEELEHKAKLELMQIGEPAAGFKISNYATGAGNPIEMDYEDLLVFAINKEDKSIKLYEDLAKTVKDEESHKLLLSLVQEETEHKQRFENEYNDILKRK
ncbi:MAG: ferritin family protein [Planctomycetota bacterium]|jgi:rubrerythrin